MPVAVSELDLAATRAFLKANRLTRLRGRSRAGAIIVESGPKDDALCLLRLRKLVANRWAVDEFHHTGRWAPLPIQGRLDDALAAVVAEFSVSFRWGCVKSDVLGRETGRPSHAGTRRPTDEDAGRAEGT